ncbi:MAG TPA: hypothetical protein VNP72_09550 [Longimicrobium sp.]|nr:hypothetical protein [Longimicrobium sp.]
MGEHPRRGSPLRVERVPGGWAVVHARTSARWTLPREEEARAFTHAGNSARSRKRFQRALRALDAEARQERGLVARSAAAELLDAPAAECFADPAAATHVVRWNALRGRSAQLREMLASGPAAFGPLRVDLATPARAAQPDHRGGEAPAWARFRAAAEAWLLVHEGIPWTPPAAFPPAAAERTAGPQPTTAEPATTIRPGAAAGPPAPPRAATRRPGLDL